MDSFPQQLEQWSPNPRRYQEMQGIGAFVWLEPGMGCAIAGNLPREPLLAVGEIVYETFEPTH